MSGEIFTIEELAAEVSGGNLAAMAKLLNDAGASPPLSEIDPRGSTVDRGTVISLYAHRAGDRVGRKLAQLLGE